MFGAGQRPAPDARALRRVGSSQRNFSARASKSLIAVLRNLYRHRRSIVSLGVSVSGSWKWMLQLWPLLPPSPLRCPKFILSHSWVRMLWMWPHSSSFPRLESLRPPSPLSSLTQLCSLSAPPTENLALRRFPPRLLPPTGTTSCSSDHLRRS